MPGSTSSSATLGFHLHLQNPRLPAPTNKPICLLAIQFPLHTVHDAYFTHEGHDITSWSPSFSQSMMMMASPPSPPPPPPPPLPLPRRSSSQTSSHAPLEPIAGTTLLTVALACRAALASAGALATGCTELDNAVLLGGGLERGCVTGVSAEEDADDVALVLGLQVVAGALVKEEGPGGRRAVIVTTMEVGGLVRSLRGVLRGMGVVDAEKEREILERVRVARVFDVFGLWEVLAEEDGVRGTSPEMMGRREETDGAVGQDEDVPSSAWGHDEHEEDLAMKVATPAQADDFENDPKHTPILENTPPAHQPELPTPEPLSSPLSEPPSSLPDTPPWETAEKTDEAVDEVEVIEKPKRTPPGQRAVIQDSEDEDGLSPPSEPVTGGSSGTTSVERLRLLSVEEEDMPLTELACERLSSPIEPSSSAAEAATDDTLAVMQAQEQDNSSSSTPYSVEVLDLEDENSSSRAVPTNEQEDQSKTPRQALFTEVLEPVYTDQHRPEPTAKESSSHPDVILITHMSTLLSSLFHQRDKAIAHQTLQLLASHLRYLTRSPEHGGPLVMILNSTTSSDINYPVPPREQDRDGPLRQPPQGGPRSPNRPLDPTLRSIFNPPPLPLSGLSYSHDTPQSRRNKPSFGLIFTQMLDMHLLCTKIPKTKRDAKALYAPVSPGTGKKVDYVWAVEVLLDQIGLWEGPEKVLEGAPRRSREQRWGAVEVEKHGSIVRLVDAFEKGPPKVPQEVVLAAGFGGRRV